MVLNLIIRILVVFSEYQKRKMNLFKHNWGHSTSFPWKDLLRKELSSLKLWGLWHFFNFLHSPDVKYCYFPHDSFWAREIARNSIYFVVGSETKVLMVKQLDRWYFNFILKNLYFFTFGEVLLSWLLWKSFKYRNQIRTSFISYSLLIGAGFFFFFNYKDSVFAKIRWYSKECIRI